MLPSKLKQSPTLSLLDSSDAAGVTSAWAADSADVTSPWAMDAASVTYSPLDVPSVGPVAFPTNVQRSLSETNASTASSDSQGEAVAIKGEAVTTKGEAVTTKGETVTTKGEGEAVTVKTELVEAESLALLSAVAVTHGPGSAVDRIAAEISSHLMSKTGMQEVKFECAADEPESH